MVVVAGGAVAKIPPRSFHSFAGSHRGDAVHRDGAVVCEGHLELAVAYSYDGVEEREREAGAGKGTHGEIARRIVYKREVAEIGDVVV